MIAGEMKINSVMEVRVPGMAKRYLAFDIESGGVTSKHSLLTAYFVVLDEDLRTVYGELELKSKPNDGMYHVTSEALGINGIDLIAHNKEAETESKCGTKLYEFLQLHCPEGKVKLTPIGHNVGFDIEFIKEHLMKGENFHKFVSYRCLDTASVIQFLKQTNHIPKDLAGSLGEIARYLEVPIQTLHTAKDDTWLTIEVLKKLQDLVQGDNL